MFVFNFLHIFSIFVDKIALFPCYLPFSRVLFVLFIVNERNTKSTTWLHEFPIDFIVFQYISRNASGKRDDIRKCLSSEMIVFLFFALLSMFLIRVSIWLCEPSSLKTLAHFTQQSPHIKVPCWYLLCLNRIYYCFYLSIFCFFRPIFASSPF